MNHDMLRRKGREGLGFKALSMCRKSCLLIVPLTKNWLWHLNTVFTLGAGISTNQSSLKVQMPGNLCTLTLSP